MASRKRRATVVPATVAVIAMHHHVDVDGGGLRDHAAEIDQLGGVAEHLAQSLGGDHLAPVEAAAEEE